MSDRKYRQRGYQDDSRDRPQEREPRPPQAPRERRPDAPRTPNLMASHDVVRCRACAQIVSPPIEIASRCPKCQAALHSCVQCASFDPGARFQCMQPIAAAVTPKDGSNECRLFTPPVRVERQTGSARSPNDPRNAFDDLFKNL
jgi:hypothetical protein